MIPNASTLRKWLASGEAGLLRDYLRIRHDMLSERLARLNPTTHATELCRAQGEIGLLQDLLDAKRLETALQALLTERRETHGGASS